MIFQQFVLPLVLLSLPCTSVAFAEPSVPQSSTKGVLPLKTELFSSSEAAVATTESDATTAADDGVLVVKAPLKYLGPYPSLALRFPNLATSSQRNAGKSGVSLDFVLDTAANTNTIQAPIAKELNCPRVAGQMYNLGDTQLDGVMEELFLTDLGTSALPGGNPNAAGLLSLAFLQIFGGGVEFQWSGKPSLTFYSGKKEEATQDMTKVAIERLSEAGNLPSITLTINGVEIRALLATGSPITVMNEEAAKLAGVERMPIGQAKEEEGDLVKVADAQGKPVDLVKSKDLVDVKAGSVEFGKVPLYVGEIPGMVALASESDGPAIVLGLDVLVQRPKMLLRYRDNEVWFN